MFLEIILIITTVLHHEHKVIPHAVLGKKNARSRNVNVIIVVHFFPLQLQHSFDVHHCLTFLGIGLPNKCNLTWGMLEHLCVHWICVRTCLSTTKPCRHCCECIQGILWVDSTSSELFRLDWGDEIIGSKMRAAFNFTNPALYGTRTGIRVLQSFGSGFRPIMLR